MDEVRIEDSVGGLHKAGVTVQEDGAEEPNFLHGVGNLVDFNPVADIVRVLNEQEDDTHEHFG